MNNLKGLWIMAAGFAVFSVTDTIAKILTADFHPFQVAWSRYLGVVIGIVVLLVLKGPNMFKSAVPKLQVLRGLFAVTSATCFIYGIRYVPLADAVAVTFSAPFLVTLFAALILKERVGPRRWAAVGIGFVGTLIIVRPGMGVFHPAIFLVLLAAVAFAFRQIISRPIGQRDATLTTLAYTGATSIIVLSIPLLFVWITPDSAKQVILLVMLTLLSGLGEFLIIRALELAEAVVVTPVHYSLIIFSTAWGYLFFDHLPDVWTWVGTSIVIGSGLYILLREKRLASSNYR